MKRALSCCWLLLTLVLSSCTDAELLPRTQVLVQIDASPAVRARASSLRVSFASGKGREPATFEDAGQERFTIDDSFSWPASLALLPKDGDSERGFRIFVEAQEAGRAFVTARVISYFIDAQTLLLEIVLEDGCVEYLSCGEQETCLASGGVPRCADAKLDPRDLKSISKAPGRQPDAGRRDAGEDASQPDANEVDASEVDAGELDAGEPDAGEPDAAQPDAGAEDCFNGVDDDLDSLFDCADPDCSGPAMCVADAAELAVKVPAGAACPSGYSRQPKRLLKDLSGGACTGCACGAAGATGCSTTITGYEGPQGCATTTAGATATVNSYACDGNNPMYGSFNAIGVGPMVVTSGSCPASGTASPRPTSWASDITLCYLERKGGGCPAAAVCVPRPETRPLCADTTATSCATGETREVWYSGVTDTRSCGACSCVASGASCAGVSVNFGNDYSCGTRNIPAGQVQCGYAYAPPYNLIGTATRATCSPTAALSGAATPTGPTTLCCRP